MRREHLTAIIECEGADNVSLCPELDIAGQGFVVEVLRPAEVQYAAFRSPHRC